MDDQTPSPSPTANPDSDFTWVASIGDSDGNSDYYKLAKTQPQAWPTRRTAQETSGNWKKCRRLRWEISLQSHDQSCSSPALTSLKFQSSIMLRPTRHKITKTMAPRCQSTPSLPHRTHHQKSPWWPLPCLCHSHMLSPATPPFKRDVRLLVANDMLYGVYQNWVHQNPRYHLHGRIVEDSKWQSRW